MIYNSKWEYLVLEGAEALEVMRMNELGAEGWELVSNYSRPAAGTSILTAVFKRPKPVEDNILLEEFNPFKKEEQLELDTVINHSSSDNQG